MGIHILFINALPFLQCLGLQANLITANLGLAYSLIRWFSDELFIVDTLIPLSPHTHLHMHTLLLIISYIYIPMWN